MCRCQLIERTYCNWCDSIMPYSLLIRTFTNFTSSPYLTWVGCLSCYLKKEKITIVY